MGEAVVSLKDGRDRLGERRAFSRDRAVADDLGEQVDAVCGAIGGEAGTTATGGPYRRQELEEDRGRVGLGLGPIVPTTEPATP